MAAAANSTNRYKAPDLRKIYLDMKNSLHLSLIYCKKK